MGCYQQCNNHKQDEMGIIVNEFSIYHIFRLIVKNFLVIFLAAVVFGVGTFCYCEFKLEERYSAKGSIVVTNGGLLEGDKTDSQYLDSNKVNNSDITASINLLDTVKDLLASNDNIYEQLSEKLDGKYSAAQLKNCVTIATRDDYSLFIDVKFEMNNPNDVPKVTNMFLELTPECVSSVIPNSRTSVITKSTQAVKTYPRTASSTAIAMIIGAILAFVVVYVISLFNTTIQSEEEFKDRYNIPVLGDIPDFATAKSGKYAKSYYKGGKYYGN